jgi:hypothetical protein
MRPVFTTILGAAVIGVLTVVSFIVGRLIIPHESLPYQYGMGIIALVCAVVGVFVSYRLGQTILGK